ncbi:unnamed protein product [Lymnaea stagnalis]|uniref:Uncharacterized protein n=1 Tax=Lymnaea stagnalis TaxID=6523 RepID=A0AAV2IP42_LYMST
MPCRGKQSVKVNDSLAKPTQEDQPSDHRCNLITDVRRQSLNLPVTQPGAVSVENKENINNAKVNGDKKKSPGFCRGEKSVDVKESKTKQLVGSKVNLKEEVVINTKAGESKKGNSKINGARKSSGSCRGQKSVEVRPSLSSSPQQEETNKNSSNVTNGNNKISSTKSGPCRGQRNVDVKDTLSTKPSETNKSDTEVETQKKDVKKTKTVTKEQSALDDGRSDVKIKADNALSGSGALPEKKPPTGRAGLCSGGSSSHLKDSLKPSKKQVERNEAKKINDGMFEEKVLHVEEQEELLDEEMEDDIVEEMETDEEEIYITSLPPPPSIKKSKKKKKKQRSSEYVDDEPDKERSLPIGSRKYKYAVTPEDTVNDPLYSSIEKKPPVKVPRKTKSGIQSSAEAQAANVEDERPTRVARQDTPQRKRKKKPLDSGQGR